MRSASATAASAAISSGAAKIAPSTSTQVSMSRSISAGLGRTRGTSAPLTSSIDSVAEMLARALHPVPAGPELEHDCARHQAVPSHPQQTVRGRPIGRRQRKIGVSSPASALAAARGQAIELPGQHVAEMIIAELAASLLQLDQRIQGLDQQIAATFRRHHQAMTIESMPGFGPILGAQLLPPTAPRRLRTSSRPQRVGSSCMTPTARST
jgi:hypothetical protein